MSLLRLAASLLFIGIIRFFLSNVPYSTNMIKATGGIARGTAIYTIFSPLFGEVQLTLEVSPPMPLLSREEVRIRTKVVLTSPSKAALVDGVFYLPKRMTLHFDERGIYTLNITNLSGVEIVPHVNLMSVSKVAWDKPIIHMGVTASGALLTPFWLAWRELVVRGTR